MTNNKINEYACDIMTMDNSDEKILLMKKLFAINFAES